MKCVCYWCSCRKFSELLLGFAVIFLALLKLVKFIEEMGLGNGCKQTTVLSRTVSQTSRKRSAPIEIDPYFEERLRRVIMESVWRECYERYEGRMKAMDDQLAILRSEIEFVRSQVARTESRASPGQGKVEQDQPFSPEGEKPSSTPRGHNGHKLKMKVGPVPPHLRSKRDAPSEHYEVRFLRRMKAFDDQLTIMRLEVEQLRSQAWPVDSKNDVELNMRSGGTSKPCCAFRINTNTHELIPLLIYTQFD